MPRSVVYPAVIPPSAPVYCVIMDGSSVYDFIQDAFVPKATYTAVEDWTPYSLAMTDVSEDLDSNIFSVNLPDSFPAGSYLAIFRSRAGASPADTDAILGFNPQIVESLTTPDEEDDETTITDPLIGLLTDEEILAKMQEAKQVTVDNQTVIEHDLPSVIAADKYAANRKATGVSGGGWAYAMRGRAIPPSATGD